MQSKAETLDQYIAQVPVERLAYFNKLRESILTNLPKGFVEEMNYGMIGYVVPHSLYPKGYHCDPKLPLPFVNLASQKNFIAFYHMGLYANQELLEWFTKEYALQCKHKLDMGKSCVRFSKMNEIPFKLIGEHMQKISVADWIKLYEDTFRKNK